MSRRPVICRPPTRRTLPPADAAVVSGSGLAVVPAGQRVEDEIPYAELGWPVGAVPGHESRVLVTAGPAGTVLLACGRSHRYEGVATRDLQRPVRDLAAAGVRRLVITCATGALAGDLAAGHVVVGHTVVDLQRAPRTRAPELRVCARSAAAAAAAVVARRVAARPGVYVAVTGPQYETPAEAAWLAGFADVVGMSAVHEVRAAAACGVSTCLLAVVTNRSGVSLGHQEVVAAAGRVREGLRGSLALLLRCDEVWQMGRGDRVVADDGGRGTAR